MKVSDYVAAFLAERKIDKVFSYIGKNAHLCDSIDKHNNLENVFTIHEQGAGFAANAYGRVTGKCGAVTATSGPGGTNLMTAIADCYFDSVPSIFIIGDVPPDECKGSRDIRQFGFQETDIMAISKPITKYAVLINDLDSLRYEFEKACFLAQHGRKGPVLISLPENFQFKTDFYPENANSFFDSEEYQSFMAENNTDLVPTREIDEVAELINTALRPVILIGGGVRLAEATSELKSFLNKTQIPTVYSLMGKDAISHDYQYNLGFLGNFGTRHANFTIANADLLVVLGSRLDNLQTGRRIETFAKDAKKIQVDIDTNELGIRLDMDMVINSDLKTFLTQLNTQTFSLEIESWHQQVLKYKAGYPAEYNLDKSDRVGNQIIANIAKNLKDDDVICVDVGEHQMLVAQSFKVKENQRVLFSGSFGAMGFALPAAIGSALANGKRAIVISGDGGFQMNIQELEVIKRRNLPIKMFVINNNSLHMVKLRQDTYLEGNSVGSKKDYSAPSFKKVGEAYGIKGYEADTMETINKVITKSLANDNPEIIDIIVDADMTTVEPRIDFNRSFEDMRPYLDREELEKQMIIES
jgi:acetolactate synthase-1/2/3 large subunit